MLLTLSSRNRTKYRHIFSIDFLGLLGLLLSEDKVDWVRVLILSGVDNKLAGDTFEVCVECPLQEGLVVLICLLHVLSEVCALGKFEF